MLVIVLLLATVSSNLACGPSTPPPAPVFNPQIQLLSSSNQQRQIGSSQPLRALPQIQSARLSHIARDAPMVLASPPQRRVVSNLFRTPIRRPDRFMLVSDPAFRFTFSPPITWTYCEPACGSGDQSIDQESAEETALTDVRDAFNAALGDLGLGHVGDHNVRFDYTPSNILLRDFNSEFFDMNGFQYIAIGKTVRYEVHREGAAQTVVAHNAILRIVHSYTFNMVLWEKLGILFRKHLLPKGIEVIQGPELMRAATGEQMTYDRRLTFNAPVPRIVHSPPRAQAVPIVREEATTEGSGTDPVELLLRSADVGDCANSTKNANLTLCNEC